MSITGGCYCQKIRYELDEVCLSDVAVCHCSVCRRVSGGTHITWVSVPLSALRWLGGEPAVYATDVGCRRYFCATCGTQLVLFTDLSPGTLDVTVSSLDMPDTVLPNRHIWVKNKLAWVNLADGLPQEAEEEL